MKFWKKLALCVTLAITSIAFSGCNCSKSKSQVSVDLDGDGVISEWEELFEKSDPSSRVINSNNVIEISSLDDLKSINEKTGDTNTYLLTKNIDCNGEELNINLGKSVLYGNNKVIKNFKLKNIDFDSSDDSEINAEVNGFIYNGAGIYDLRLFMGYQTININNLKSYTLVSPFVNVANLDTVTIKGKLSIKRIKTEGLGNIGENHVDTSLCAVSLEDISNELVDGYYSPSVRNVETIGVIDYSEDMGCNSIARIGSIMPHVSELCNLFNVQSKVDITALSSGVISMGGIAGVNESMIAKANFTGAITLAYEPNSTSFVGGIVGRNYENAETKNCVANANISFDNDVVSSIRPVIHVGGIAGRTLGVISYAESNSNINFKNAVEIYAGGISGTSQNAIFTNIINRTKTTLDLCQDVYVSEICGVSKYGYFEKIVDTGTILVNNDTIVSSVKLGMVTIFEDFSNTSADLMYNAEYTPSFFGIMLGGTNTIRQQRSENNTSSFRYDLGLRNLYEYEVIDEETGLPKTKVRVDSSGNPVVDEDGKEILDIVTGTNIPDVYNKLFYMSSYSLKKLSVTADGSTIQDNVNIAYAKNESKTNCVNEVSDARLLVNFFVGDLGFRYGLNHNEINLEYEDGLISLDKLYFTLSDQASVVGYFNEIYLNGELSAYDRYFEDALTFDKNTDKNSEIYSYLNALLLSNNSKLYVPIKVTKEFASAFDENNSDMSLSLERNLSQNIGYIMGLIIGENTGVTPSITELDNSRKDILDSTSESIKVRYENLEISDSEYRYVLTINVASIVDDENRLESDYVLYLSYTKANKY